jgi:U-box domain
MTMSILRDSTGDDCNCGLSEPIGKGEAAAAVTRTETVLGGTFGLDDDEENANTPPRITFQWRAMMNATAATTTTGNSNGDEQPNEELPPTDIRRSEDESIPHALLKDPLTNKRMVDPVVNPAGDSYERSSLLLTDESIEFYPNRALQAILKQQDEYEKRNSKESPVVAASYANGWWFHDLTKHSSPPLPEAFYCPITCDIMVDPWIGPDGSTYEYDGIEAWLAQSDRDACSPVTRQTLSLGQLRPNHALYELIQLETQRPPSERLAAVQKWMDSTPSTARTPRPNHPLPIAVIPLLPYSSSSSSASQVATSQEEPATQVASGAATLTTVSEDASRVPWWINFLCVVVMLVLVFLFIPLRIALLIAFAIAFFILCHCSCTVSY